MVLAGSVCNVVQGLKLKKILRFLANWRNIVAKCKFLAASLYNVNDTAHSMAQSIIIKLSENIADRSQYKINLEVRCLIYI